MAEWAALIPLPWPSLNEWSRRHWRVEQRLRERWAARLQLWFPLEARRGREQRRRRKIRVIRYGARRLDSDNADGGGKPCIDAMRHVGLIYQDSPVWIDRLPVEQVTCPTSDRRLGHTMIVITDLGEGPKVRRH